MNNYPINIWNNIYEMFYRINKFKYEKKRDINLLKTLKTIKEK